MKTIKELVREGKTLEEIKDILFLQEKKTKAEAEAVLASAKYFAEKAAKDNKCKCGKLIATSSSSCRDCLKPVGNPIENKVVGHRIVRAKIKIYQGGLCSPR